MSTVVLVGVPLYFGETTVSWLPFTTWMEVPAENCAVPAGVGKSRVHEVDRGDAR